MGPTQKDQGARNPSSPTAPPPATAIARRSCKIVPSRYFKRLRFWLSAWFIAALLPGLAATPPSNDKRPRGVPVVWSHGSQERIIRDSNVRDAVALAANGYEAYALQADGTPALLIPNFYSDPSVPPGATNLIAISGGENHYVGLRRDGTVATWGANNGDVFRDIKLTVPEGLRDVVEVTAGSSHSVALKRDGTLVTWGHNFWGNIEVPEGLSNIISVTAGKGYTLAASTDGALHAWGNLFRAGTYNVPDLTGIAKIETGIVAHSIAWLTNGTLHSWVGPQFSFAGWKPMPAGLSNIVAISSSYGQCYALRADGTVVAWGKNDYSVATLPPGLTNVIAIDGGYDFGIALVRRPVIANRNENHFVRAGDQLQLNVDLIASDDYTYTVYLNNARLIQTNSPNIIIPGIQPIHDGPIRLRVENPALGVDEQDIGVLTVLAPPSGTIHPAPMTIVRHGEQVTFTANFLGTSPIHYEWRCLESGNILSTNSTVTLGWSRHCSTLALRASNAFGSTESYAQLVLLASGELVGIQFDGQRARLTLNVEPARSYTLQFSADLTNWIPVATFKSQQPTFELGELPPPSTPRRFYRLVSP